MFNIGIGELLFIAVLALIVLGPERLPKVMRQLGEYAHTLRTVLANFNSEFAEELKPINEIRSLAQDLNPMRQLGAAMDATQPRQTIAPPAALAGTAAATAAPSMGEQRRPANPMAQLRGAMTTELDGGSTSAAVAAPADAALPVTVSSSEE